MRQVSIIVPVYNAEAYIKDTLESIAVQSYRSIEVIIVDDGSMDGSGEICRSFASNDKRFQYHRIPNSGPSNARNIGIGFATGDYIGFCDSDDRIEPDMYAALVEYMEKNDADIALCDIYSERDKRSFGFPWKDGTVFEQAGVREELMAAMIGNRSDADSGIPIWGSVVRCLYKRKIIMDSQVCFPTDIHFAEDLVFTLRYLSNVQRAVICDRAMYYYTCNEKSLMHSFYAYKPNMFEARVRLVGYLEEIIQHLDGCNGLQDRLLVTARCYYRECVGNACRPGEKRNASIKKQELKTIVNHPSVREAFLVYKAGNRKTQVIYFMIEHRCVCLLYFYYYFRFRQ